MIRLDVDVSQQTPGFTYDLRSLRIQVILRNRVGLRVPEISKLGFCAGLPLPSVVAEEFRALLEEQSKGGRRPRARSKYGVRHGAVGQLLRTVDGIESASQAEATHYTVLCNREAAGLIQGLVLQPSFELEETFTDDAGKRHRAITYTADFAYTQDGRTVVEEVKGHAARDFSLRMRLFLYRHPEAVYKLVRTGEVLVVVWPASS